MRSIELSRSAENDFEAAYRWYYEQSPRAAKRFTEAIQVVLQQVLSAPDAWSRYDDNHHFHVVSRYPYHLIYFFDKSLVTIVAVAHGAREPDYWQK